MPVCDELDTVSHVTQLTTANSRDVMGGKVVGKRCIGSSVERAEPPRDGSSQHGCDEVGRIQLAGCKTRLWVFRIERIPFNVRFLNNGAKITWI